MTSFRIKGICFIHLHSDTTFNVLADDSIRKNCRKWRDHMLLELSYLPSLFIHLFILLLLLFFQFNPFPNDKLDSSKFKEFVDDNFELEENGEKLSRKDRKRCGKRRNCSLRAISPFPTVFSKDFYCRHVKTRACLGKG